MASILIKNGRLWDGERFLFADVLTEGSRISKIGKDIANNADYTFDAMGKTVSAGLVDVHVHMQGIAPEAFGIQTEMSSLPFGVTAANDAGSSCGDEALLDSFAVKTTVFANSRIISNQIDLAFTENLLQKYGSKAIGVKMYFDTTQSGVRDAAPLRELCRYAHSKGLKVMVHCANSPTPMAEIAESLCAGDILTHIYHGGENTCDANDFEAFKIAKSRGVILDAGFAGHVHTDFHILDRAIRAGFLPDTIGTDITKRSAYKRGGRYGMTLCMNMAKTACMPEEAIFKAITSNAAKALGKEQAWGYLQEGRCADIAVFEECNEGFDLTDHAGNRLYNNKGFRCVLTVLDGQIVYRY